MDARTMAAAAAASKIRTDHLIADAVAARYGWADEVRDTYYNAIADLPAVGPGGDPVPTHRVGIAAVAVAWPLAAR